ncbi:MAG: spermine synthase [Gammaproteobacteria bacterium]|nr:spermine synthase [Gammaproteobacteria bacterium]
MYKYDGLVIYQHHDDEGILEVVEHNGVRSLHFGSNAKQSSISLQEPETLQLPYARAMTAWRLFKDKLDNALLIGLGGGSLARYIHYHYPGCKLTAVEYRPSVVQVAQHYFGLPMDERLHVITGDGGAFIREQALEHEQIYDLMIIDAFDVDGLADSVASIAFFDACKQLLKPDGVLAVNLWESQRHITPVCFSWLECIFSDKVLKLPIRNRGNLLVFGFNADTPRAEWKAIKSKAETLEENYHIEYSHMLRDINRHNPYNIHTLINKS